MARLGPGLEEIDAAFADSPQLATKPGDVATSAAGLDEVDRDWRERVQKEDFPVVLLLFVGQRSIISTTFGIKFPRIRICGAQGSRASERVRGRSPVGLALPYTALVLGAA